MTHAIDVLVAYETGDGVFRNHECDFRWSMNGGHRCNNSSFAVSMQSNTFCIDVGSRSKQVDSGDSVIRQVIEGGRLPISCRSARSPLVIKLARQYPNGRTDPQ